MSFVIFFRKNDAKTDCTNAETQLTESMNKLKVTEDSRQPLLLRKKEIQGNFIKYENKKNAYEKMIKDIEFIKNQLKREKEKSTTFINQYMVCFRTINTFSLNIHFYYI